MKVRPLLLAGLALALVAARDDPLAGRIAGKPQQCIQLFQNTNPEIVDSHTILYRFTDRRVWKTGPVGPCPSLRPLQTLIVEVNGSQLCRNDRFRVLTPGTVIPSAYCRLDRFTPYDLPKR